MYYFTAIETQIFFIPSYTLWRRRTLDYSLLDTSSYGWTNMMLRFVYVSSMFMYHHIDYRYGSVLLFLRLTRLLWYIHHQTVLVVKGVDTCAFSSYYKLFNYLVLIELIAFHPTFWVSRPLRGLTYSRIKLHYISHLRANETHSLDRCWRVATLARGTGSVPYPSYTGVIIVYRLPHRRQWG